MKYLIMWTSESGLAKQPNYDLPSTISEELSILVLETFYNESFELLRPSSVWSKAKQTNSDEFLTIFCKVQLHILFNSAKTWFVIVSWSLLIYLSWTWNCFEHQNRTILGSTQVNSGENPKINKQSHVKFWLNWIKYCLIFIKLY